MAIVKPFCAIRPAPDKAAEVAALPYDVYNRKEACDEVKNKPLSFLNIDRPETQFDDSVDIYSDCVYEKAKELLEKQIQDKTFIQDKEPSYYVYELTMNNRTQTGIVACSSIDDYDNQIIKKHENTRAEKEIDRIRHVDTCNAQTGPIFLAYRSNNEINSIVSKVKSETPQYDFITDDEIRHTVWQISSTNTISQLENLFNKILNTYIADGHHRAASAVSVGHKRRKENKGNTYKEAYNYFLSVLFPDDQLLIMPYNRVVKDLNGYTADQLIQKISTSFFVEGPLNHPVSPEAKGRFGMFLDGKWYKLIARPELVNSDPVKGLDVSILQDTLLGPILGIGDPRTDNRIDFIGGIRGLKELERQVNEGMEVAFSMYPTSIAELFAVADANLLMPPKSTWFEPKLRSGLFIHKI